MVVEVSTPIDTVVESILKNVSGSRNECIWVGVVVVDEKVWRELATGVLKASGKRGFKPVVFNAIRDTPVAGNARVILSEAIRRIPGFPVVVVENLEETLAKGGVLKSRLLDVLREPKALCPGLYVTRLSKHPSETGLEWVFNHVVDLRKIGEQLPRAETPPPVTPPTPPPPPTQPQQPVKRKPRYRIVAVDRDTWLKLHELRIEMGLRSIDELVGVLVNQYEKTGGNITVEPGTRARGKGKIVRISEENWRKIMKIKYKHELQSTADTLRALLGLVK